MASMDAQHVVENLRNFYNKVGWRVSDSGLSQDAILNEDLRPVASEYVARCRQRIQKYLPSEGEHLLDMASGPIQYPEYLEYSSNFKKRHCVDLSQVALDQAAEKIKDHGHYYCGDFLDLDFEERYFDATISCHTLYHMHEDVQERAVRKLLKLTKVGQPVIIIYTNPNHLLGKIARMLKSKSKRESEDKKFYFHSHPRSFWEKFSDVATLEYYPWRSFSSSHQKRLFPNNLLGRWMFKSLFRLEELFPSFFISYFKFYTVVLRSRTGVSLP